VDGQTAERLKALDFQYEIIGAQVGAATAIKMVRSLFVKGLEVLTVETLLAAEASGCLPEIRDSLAKSYAGLGWPDFAHYEFERVLKHGVRRAAEMHECAATLHELGLHGELATAIAEVQSMTALAGSGISLAGELEPVLADLVGKRTHKEA
jgi:3-hydroxyisobutyrate dehydrogenase-like beta-hydroxyacid dehydrogenase